MDPPSLRLEVVPREPTYPFSLSLAACSRGRDARCDEVLRDRSTSQGGTVHPPSGPEGGVSRNSVRRILRGTEVAASPKSEVGRPPIAEHFEGQTRQIMEERPDLPTVEVLRLLLLQGYHGGKNPVYQLVRRLRKAVGPPPLVLFDGLVGESSQNDFGSVRVR